MRILALGLVHAKGLNWAKRPSAQKLPAALPRGSGDSLENQNLTLAAKTNEPAKFSGRFSGIDRLGHDAPRPTR